MAFGRRHRLRPLEEYRPLVVRMLAADDGINRVTRFRSNGETYLAHAVTGEPLPRPSAGVHFSDYDGNEAPIPACLRVNHGTQLRYGWLEFEGERAVHRPGGPPGAPWSTTHTFIHADTIVLHLLQGAVRYKVVRQPDKYDSEGNPTDKVGDPTAEVDWFYLAERES